MSSMIIALVLGRWRVNKSILCKCESDCLSDLVRLTVMIGTGGNCKKRRTKSDFGIWWTRRMKVMKRTSRTISKLHKEPFQFPRTHPGEV